MGKVDPLTPHLRREAIQMPRKDHGKGRGGMDDFSKVTELKGDHIRGLGWSWT